LEACQVVSEVWNKRCELLASSRTTKKIWLAPPVSVRTTLAK
jgi:hypothetical protein